MNQCARRLLRIFRGAVKSVQNFGAGDLLEISPAGGGPTWWLPFTKEAVPEVRIAERRLIAVPPTVLEGEPEAEGE